MGLALLVADDAISVKLARRRLAEIDPATAISARRPRVRRAVQTVIAMTGGAALALAGATWMLTVHRAVAPATQASPAASAIAGAQVDSAQGNGVAVAPPLWRFVKTTTDDFGQPTKLSGPDPESVLRAFCYAAPAGAEVEPVGLSSAIPPQPAVRWGVFRVRGDAGFVQRAIVIRHDPRTLQWTTGNGRANVFNAFDEEGPQIFPDVEKLSTSPGDSSGPS